MHVANRQNEDYLKANPGVGVSQAIHSAEGADGRSDGQASSPHSEKRKSARREGSVNSGGGKQLQIHDPTYAKKRNAEKANASHSHVNRGKEKPATSSRLSRRKASRQEEATRRDIRRRNHVSIRMMPAKGLTTKEVTQDRIGMMTAIQPWKMPAIKGQSIRFTRDHLGLG